MEEKEFSQLRFDISETVRLHPQQSGIGSLLNLDLYPEVEITDRGKHLKIQGYLRLRGDYIADDVESQKTDQKYMDLHTEDQEEISYIIPVEITLPSDRVQMDQLAAEIESFDYTVLSPFELQIEAILSIDGLLPEPTDNHNQMDTAPSFAGYEAQSADYSQTPEESSGFEFDSPQEEETVLSPEFSEQHDEEIVEEVENQEEQNDQEQLDQYWVQPELEHQEIEQQLEREQPDAEIPLPNNLQIETPVEEVSEEVEETEGADFEPGLDEENEQEAEPHESLDNVEKWSSWLLNNRKEAFIPMRMVIVQEDDSLIGFAEKYGVSHNHLVEMNQLDDDRVAEGMVLNVPPVIEEEVTSNQQ